MALSRGFPRVGVTDHPALRCPDFPRRHIHLRDCSACPTEHSPHERAPGLSWRIAPRRRAQPGRRPRCAAKSSTNRAQRGLSGAGQLARTAAGLWQRVHPVLGAHRLAADRAVDGPMAPELGPGAGDELIQGRLVVASARGPGPRVAPSWPWHSSARPPHEMLRISPTTLPSTWTSRLRIGSIVSFSGCRRMWSLS